MTSVTYGNHGIPYPIAMAGMVLAEKATGGTTMSNLRELTDNDLNQEGPPSWRPLSFPHQIALTASAAPRTSGAEPKHSELTWRLSGSQIAVMQAQPKTRDEANRRRAEYEKAGEPVHRAQGSEADCRSLLR